MSKLQAVIEAFHAGAVVNLVYHNKVSKSTRKDQRRKVECTIEKLNLSKPFFLVKLTKAQMAKQITDGKKKPTQYRTFYWSNLRSITYK